VKTLKTQVFGLWASLFFARFEIIRTILYSTSVLVFSERSDDTWFAQEWNSTLYKLFAGRGF
jgi:hypothetical protein